MPEVFISYSRKDKDFVASLHQALAEQQRETWLDTKDIPPTAEWLKEIFGAIEAADTFVFVISPDGILSEVCQQEIMHALKHHKRIIPVVRREVDPKIVPEPISKLNWLFFRDHDSFDNSFQALVKAINTDLEYVREHTRFLTKAIDWENREKDKGLLLRGIDLKEGEKWLAQSGDKEPRTTPLQMNYILASRQGAVRRQRTLLGAVTFGLAVAVGLALVAFYLYREADKRGRIALSRQLAAQSASLPDQDDFRDLHDMRLLLSAHALETFETSEAKSALAKNLLFNPRRIGYLENYGGFAFSPDGKYYAYPINEKSTIIVDLITRRPKHTALQGLDPLFSPDGKLLATQTDQEIIIWDVETGKPLSDKKIPRGAMVWRSQPKTELGVARQRNIDFIAADGRVAMRVPLPPNMGEIKTMTFRHDGKILAALDEKQQVFLWDAFDKTSSVIQIPRANTLVFTPEGDLMGLELGQTETRADTGEMEIPVIKVSTSKPELSVRKIPAKRFISGASPDGRYLALEGSSEKGGNALFVWDIQNRRFLEPVLETPSFYPANRGAVWAVFSPDGNVMAAHSYLNDNIYLWDLTGNQMFYREIKWVAGKVSDLKLALDHDGKVLVTLDPQKNLVFWDVGTRKALDIKKSLPGNLRVKDIIFTPDNRLIALMATKETAYELTYRLWDVQEAKFISPALAINARYRCLSRDGQVLVATSDDDISLWNVQTQKIMEVIKPERFLTGISLSPDKKLLAWTWKRGSVIELWDVAQKKPLDPLRGGGYLMRFSPDGKTLVDPGSGLTFWDLATRQSWTIPIEEDIWALAFSGNGKLLAVAGTKGEDPKSKIGVIRLYNLDTSSWPGIACRIANRNLNRSEWREYMGDLPYQPLCPGLPVPNDEPVVTQAPEKTEK